MAFKIRFTDDPDEYLSDDPGILSAIGEIVVGDFIENFASTLYEWSRRDYEAQWAESLRAFLSGDQKAVLITHYLHPENSSNLEWWVLYRGQHDLVHIQNHLPW